MVTQRKRDIVKRLCECFQKYKQVTIVSLDNVSTNQIHNARDILRTGQYKGEMIIGKNTLIKKALSFMTGAQEPGEDDDFTVKVNKKLLQLEPLMKLNVGLIFSEEPYIQLKEKIEAEKIKMPARPGIIAPCNVIIPAGPTGIDTKQINLFHKLNFQCKTVKSNIEIVKEKQIITKGVKVTEGAYQICNRLQIVPFEYALAVQAVYLDGVILDESVIDMPADAITDKIKDYAGYLTALSLGANIPNSLSVPQFLANGFKSLLAIGAESGYKFKELENAMNCAQQATTSAPKDAPKAAKKEEAPAPEEEEEDEDMDICNLFD